MLFQIRKKTESASLKRACAVPLGEKAPSGKETMSSNDYFFNLHKDIVTRQGKTCPKCKRSLVLADKLSVVDGSMYCGKCGELESRKYHLKRELNLCSVRKKSDKTSLARARAQYDRVRKSGS